MASISFGIKKINDHHKANLQKEMTQFVKEPEKKELVKKLMKTIGLIGGITPESTILYIRNSGDPNIIKNLDISFEQVHETVKLLLYN